jgi:hypothetical protein
MTTGVLFRKINQRPGKGNVPGSLVDSGVPVNGRVSYLAHEVGRELSRADFSDSGGRRAGT